MPHYDWCKLSWTLRFTINSTVSISMAIVFIPMEVDVSVKMPIINILRPGENKANLRDLIAATGLVILLKLDENRRFFSPRDLEIWWMTSKYYRAPLLHDIKRCASSETLWWIQTWVTVWKCSIRVKFGDFLSRATLKFDGWPWKIIGHLFYVASSFVHHFIAIGEFKLKLQSGNAKLSKSVIYCPMWSWNLTDDLDKQ